MIALALLLAAPPTDPLPDGKTVDTLTFTFVSHPIAGPAGSFSLTRAGKVSYSHQTAPHTGSGGHVTQAAWEIPKAEAEAIFENLLREGLLALPESAGGGFSAHYSFHVTSGRWHAAVQANPVPEKILAPLRPLLEKAHPAVWKLPPAPMPGVAKKPALTRFRYSFTEKLDGPVATLVVNRDGRVTYSRKTHPTGPGGSKMLVEHGWAIPAADAEKLLDALVADGVFDLTDTGGGKFPNHHVQANVGRWATATFPREMSDAVMKHLRPLLEKGEPALWKK